MRHVLYYFYDYLHDRISLNVYIKFLNFLSKWISLDFKNNSWLSFENYQIYWLSVNNNSNIFI